MTNQCQTSNRESKEVIDEKELLILGLKSQNSDFLEKIKNYKTQINLSLDKAYDTVSESETENLLNSSRDYDEDVQKSVFKNPKIQKILRNYS